MTLRNLTLVLAAAGMGCAGIGPARAETPTEPLQAGVTPAVQTTAPQAKAVEAAPAIAEPAAFQGKPLDSGALGDLRGSGGIVVGNQTLSAITSGNSTIGNYTAGAVNISQSALSNFNGLGNITINTGAMSQLQSAMNVTVNVAP